MARKFREVFFELNLLDKVVFLFGVLGTLGFFSSRNPGNFFAYALDLLSEGWPGISLACITNGARVFTLCFRIGEAANRVTFKDWFFAFFV